MPPRENRLNPRDWGYDLVPFGLFEIDFRIQSSVLIDRYERGVGVWRELLATRFWQLSKRKSLQNQLRNLRGEYRDLLRTLVDAHQRTRVKSAPVAQRRVVHRDATPGSRVYESNAGDPVPLVLPEGSIIDLDDLRKGTSFEVPMSDTPDTYSGHGGHFGGAGASGSWDSGSSGDSGSSSCDSITTDDSGSSSNGGGGVD